MRQPVPPLSYDKPWRLWHLLLLRTAGIFTVLFCLTIAFPYNVFPRTGYWLHGLFEPLARFTGRHVFGLHAGFTSELISDSTGFYCHIFNLLVLSVVVALITALMLNRKVNTGRLWYGLQVTIRYYMALHLLIYGFSKVFKMQFYLPEPNTLYTPLGQLHGDIAYWSIMGASHPYSVFLGLAEVAAALLLLFRKTMLAGAIAALGILLNVWALNLFYDISVKIHSGTLLLFSLILLWPYSVRLLRFLAGGTVSPLHLWSPSWRRPYIWLQRVLKLSVIGLLFWESLYPALQSGRLNDDKAARPFLHGAWQVDYFVADGDTLPPLLTDTVRWKRVFFHRQQYLITEKMNDEMMDYALEYDTAHKRLYVSPEADSLQWPLHYELLNDSMLVIYGRLNNINLEAYMTRLPYKKLPLLQGEFKWTVD